MTPCGMLFSKLRQCVSRRLHTCQLVLDSGKGQYGGSIREAGGAFAEREKAKEDQYFYNLQKDQLKRLKEKSQKKIQYHREQIEKHEAAIKMEEENTKDHQG